MGCAQLLYCVYMRWGAHCTMVVAGGMVLPSVISTSSILYPMLCQVLSSAYVCSHCCCQCVLCCTTVHVLCLGVVAVVVFVAALLLLPRRFTYCAQNKVEGGGGMFVGPSQGIACVCVCLLYIHRRGQMNNSNSSVVVSSEKENVLYCRNTPLLLLACFNK